MDYDAPLEHLKVDFQYEQGNEAIYVQHDSTIGVRLSIKSDNMIWLDPHQAAKLACEIHAAAMAVIDEQKEQ